MDAERTRFNQRKAEILGLLDGVGESTASEVAQKLGITSVNASRLMGLYFLEGLLGRRTINKFGQKSYEITNRGRERLRWILGETPR